MTDKELIQALRHCASGDEYGCLRCPGEATCDECSGKSLMDAADRLEALLAENAEMSIQIQKEICKRVEVEAENERLKAQLPKWRPAGNPPKESVTVFARDMAGVVTTAYHNGSWHGMLNCDAVTHWMPLPSTEGVE